MKAATVKQIKDELNERSPKELLDYCLRLSKFKKENKELLTYLLFEASDEASFIQSIKNEMDEDFANVNRQSYYYVKKGIRKILRNVKKYIRYSKNKETEVDLLIYFCKSLQSFTPSIRRSSTMTGLYDRQIEFIKKKIEKLHEDLQYDYGQELENM